MIGHFEVKRDVGGESGIGLRDQQCRTRQGQGTHDRVLRGMRLLRQHGVPFYVITVLTAEALLYGILQLQKKIKRVSTITR